MEVKLGNQGNYLEHQLDKAIEYAEKNLSYNALNLIEHADNVCIFGLGTYFREAFIPHSIREEYHVNLLCDNDPSKWGHTYEGIKCISPAELTKYDNLVVIIMVGNSIPIEEQLKKMKIKYVTHLELALDDIMEIPTSVSWFRNEKNSIKEAFGLLKDNESKKVFVNALCNRMAPELSECTWNDLYCNGGGYFNSGYFKINSDEVYVDCGAYTGDSISEFCRIVKNEYRKIFAFELDENNYRLMKEKITIKNGQMYNYGVWDENRTIEYGVGTTYDSKEGICIWKTKMVGNQAIKKAEVRRIDDILLNEEVSFIKMDIEGAEIKGICGAEKIIKTQKPKLAICVYHKISDFWQVPLLINKLNSNYQFALMHQCKYGLLDSILYAW